MNNIKYGIYFNDKYILLNENPIASFFNDKILKDEIEYKKNFINEALLQGYKASMIFNRIKEDSKYIEDFSEKTNYILDNKKGENLSENELNKITKLFEDIFDKLFIIKKV